MFLQPQGTDACVEEGMHLIRQIRADHEADRAQQTAVHQDDGPRMWLCGSWRMASSRMESAIRSQILSGCPLVTDSDVKNVLAIKKSPFLFCLFRTKLEKEILFSLSVLSLSALPPSVPFLGTQVGMGSTS